MAFRWLRNIVQNNRARRQVRILRRATRSLAKMQPDSPSMALLSDLGPLWGRLVVWSEVLWRRWSKVLIGAVSAVGTLYFLVWLASPEWEDKLHPSKFLPDWHWGVYATIVLSLILLGVLEGAYQTIRRRERLYLAREFAAREFINKGGSRLVIHRRVEQVENLANRALEALELTEATRKPHPLIGELVSASCLWRDETHRDLNRLSVVWGRHFQSEGDEPFESCDKPRKLHRLLIERKNRLDQILEDMRTT
jgi:hypothetical protein